MALVGHVTEQSSHAAPAVPQAVVDVPGWHMVPPQQAPLQGDDPLQLAPQRPALHALPERQSASFVQPQVPPVRQAEPLLLEQSTQADVEPHAVDEVPDTHVPALLQHPPLHVSAAVHVVEQTPLAGSHASPTAQSFEVMQTRWVSVRESVGAS